MGAPASDGLGGPAGRSPRRATGAPAGAEPGHGGPRERRRWGVRRGEAPGAPRARPPERSRGMGAPASDGVGGSGGAKPPGLVREEENEIDTGGFNSTEQR